MRRWWNDTAGWLQLRLAVWLHRTVAGRAATERLQAQRNRAIRAANAKGVTVEKLAAQLRLSPGWVRQVLAGRKPPAVEEAA